MKYFFALLALFLFPLVLFAQATTSAELSAGFVPLTNVDFIAQAGNAFSLEDFLNGLYRLCIGLAAVVAVLQIMRAGILYMGGDSVTEKKEAKNLIAVSIGGLILVLSPVIVFSIVNPEILNLKIGRINELNVELATSTASTTATSTITNPTVDRLQCSISYVERRPAPDCSALGASWETISSQCCVAAGQNQCCGRTASQPEPEQTGPGFRYRIAVLRDGPPQTCVQYEAETRPTVGECVVAKDAQVRFQEGLGHSVVTTKECNAQEVQQHMYSRYPEC